MSSTNAKVGAQVPTSLRDVFYEKLTDIFRQPIELSFTQPLEVLRGTDGIKNRHHYSLKGKADSRLRKASQRYSNCRSTY